MKLQCNLELIYGFNLSIFYNTIKFLDYVYMDPDFLHMTRKQ